MACGNREALGLLPGQRLMIETPLAESLTGQPYALVQAEALEGWRGVTPSANRQPGLCLRLARPGLIYAGPGLILACPGADGAELPGLPALAPARGLLARMAALELAAALATDQSG